MIRRVLTILLATMIGLGAATNAAAADPEVQATWIRGGEHRIPSELDDGGEDARAFQKWDGASRGYASVTFFAYDEKLRLYNSSTWQRFTAEVEYVSAAGNSYPIRDREIPLGSPVFDLTADLGSDGDLAENGDIKIRLCLNNDMGDLYDCTQWYYGTT